MRGPWLQEQVRAAVVAKPSKNKPRKIRARRLTELERGREAAVGVARDAGSRPVECVALEGVDQGVEESKGSDPVLVAHNGSPKARPEVEDVPGVWSDSDSEEDERPAR